ncbi:hypothetical protein G6F50_018423 [Rhizopus delemar]|uniref:Uncharacterized protein n=1 Tax=Rhizopus delemar TaxID=936053 RepID=A0A9P6XMR3_9FUNG|nr:hypothetical protein G6F50_018423 [Rhizopus delemar]
MHAGRGQAARLRGIERDGHAGCACILADHLGQRPARDVGAAGGGLGGHDGALRMQHRRGKQGRRHEQ